MEDFMSVRRTTKPPKRKEGAGFTIVDIMSGIDDKMLDPFLMWHELPRAFHRPGEMPGAPMHPHRGFSECPYCKEICGKDGPNENDCFLGGDHEGNTHKMRSGDFEFGQVGRGFEHEGLLDPSWSGYLHFFQLWINLPREHKMDDPSIVNCAASKLPVAEISTSPPAIDGTVKVLIGEDIFGATSPMTSPFVPVQYLDFELAAGGTVIHEPPAMMQTRLAYVYKGQVDFGGEVCSAGQFVVFAPGKALRASAADKDAGFLFLAGQRIGEPVAKYGPFVMTTREELSQCMSDYQKGKLCGKITRTVIE